MIRTVDFRYKGRSFVIAFASEDDAWRFIMFTQEHETECAAENADAVYRLDPQWSMGQYNHVPCYAVYAIDPEAIRSMIGDLIRVRETGDEQSTVPEVRVIGSKDSGLAFHLDKMPQPRLVN